MFGKILVVLCCIYQCFVADATSFIVESYQSESGVTQLKYVNNTSRYSVDLKDILSDYGYAGAVLPETTDGLEPYLKMYSESNEYMLSCDSKFLAPIKSTIWTIKFALISGALYPKKEIDKLKGFCTLIMSDYPHLEFKKFLIKVLFKLNGLRNLYSEIKEHEGSFHKNLSSGKLRSDFNAMLDIVDPDEEIDRFKR